MPDSSNPTVESTFIIDAPTCTGLSDFVFGVTSNIPLIKSLGSLNPTNNDILKYDFPCLVNISTSDTDAFVLRSSDMNTVCPIIFLGSPPLVINSATIVSLLINSAPEGLIKKPSKSTTFDSTPYKTLNKIDIDSSIPFDW